MFSFSCIGSFLLINFTGHSLLPQYVWATASGGLLYRRPDEVYNLFERGSGLEYSRDAQLLELGGVLVWNYTSDGDQDVVHALFAQQLHDAGHDRVMGSGEDGQSDDLDVLLQRSVYDHFRGLAKASVNDLHAGVAESTSDHFRSPVVAVQTGFGDQHPDTIHMNLF